MVLKYWLTHYAPQGDEGQPYMLNSKAEQVFIRKEGSREEYEVLVGWNWKQELLSQLSLKKSLPRRKQEEKAWQLYVQTKVHFCFLSSSANSIYKAESIAVQLLEGDFEF